MVKGARFLGCATAALLAGVLMAPHVVSAASSAGAPLADAEAKQEKAAVSALLQQKADVNAAQPDGATALHWAAHWDDLATADLLIRAGANVNAKNDYGATPLSLACMNGNSAMVDKLLTAGANPNTALPSGETPLMRCARSGATAAVKALLARKAAVDAADKDKGQTALMWAVSQKHADAAQVLIQAGADVKAHSVGGFSPLMFAARVGDVESGKALVAAGADVNKKGPNGMTPLLLASASGQEALGIFLLDKGADANARDDYGATALHYAFVKGITSLNGVRLANYVQHLFRPSERELVKALLAHKANPNVQIQKPIRFGGSADAAVVGATPLMLAAASPDAEAMQLLLKAGADPKIATKKKMTVLMATAGLYRGQDYTPQDKPIALQAAQLVIAQSDVNAVTDDGLTAMHGAASNGADGVVQLLVSKGAKLDVRDRYQQTPLSIATGIRLPWIPDGDELGEIIQPSTRELLLKLGATPTSTPGYFKPPKEDSDAYRVNRGVRGLDLQNLK